MQSIFKDINSITFIGASSCNLNCEYCIVGGCSSETFKKFNKCVQAGWKNGTTVRNAIDTLNDFNAPIDQIVCCNFTGGEPFLSPHGVDWGVRDILHLLPSVKKFYFTTNLFSVEGFINTLREIVNTTDREIGIQLVCSIDGPENSDSYFKGHAVPWEIFKSNLQKIADFFANDVIRLSKKRGLTFQPIRCIKILFHSTMSLNTFIGYFSNESNILMYLKFLYKKCAELSSVLAFKPFLFGFSFPEIARPFKCTFDKGVQVLDILRKWDSLSCGYFFGRSDLIFADILHASFASFSLGGYQKTFDTETMCNGFLHNPLVLPDGTLVQCFAHLGTFLQKNRLSNIVTVSEEEKLNMEDVNWLADAKYNSSLLNLNLTYGLVDELSLSGQVPFKYFGNYSIKRDAIAAMHQWSHCTSEDVKETGIFYLTYAGKLRLFLNGIYDYINASNSDQRNMPLTKFSNVIIPEASVWKGKKWNE